MDRTSIEERDRNLLRAFRDKIAQKAEAAQDAPPAPRNNRGWIVMILTASIIIAVMVWTQRTGNTSKSGVISPPPDATPSPPAVVITAPKMVQETRPTQYPTPPPKGSGLITGSGATPEIPAVSVTEIEKPRIPIPAQVDSMISDLKTCRSVKARQCVSPTEVFSIQDRVKPMVWMTVLTKTPPFTLRHVYYLNGEKYCSVPLDIKNPRTRTWSQITVKQKKHLGAWRVDVVDENDHVLKQASFEVTP